MKMGLCHSNSRLLLSPWNVPWWERASSLAPLQLPPSPRAGAYCQTTAAGHARGSICGPPPASVCCSRSKRTGVVQDLCAVQPCGAGLQHPAGCCWEACSQPCEQGKARAPAGLVPSGYRKCNSFLQSGGARGTQEGPSFCTPSDLNLLPPNPTRGGSVQIPSQSQLVSTAHSVSARGGASPCSSS